MLAHGVLADATGEVGIAGDARAGLQQRHRLVERDPVLRGVEVVGAARGSGVGQQLLHRRVAAGGAHEPQEDARHRAADVLSRTHRTLFRHLGPDFEVEATNEAARRWRGPEPRYRRRNHKQARSENL